MIANRCSYQGTSTLLFSSCHLRQRQTETERENLYILVQKGGAGSCVAGVYENEIGERQEDRGKVEGGEEKEDINMSSALPHGGEECIANTSDCSAQTKHILCGKVMHGVSHHSQDPCIIPQTHTHLWLTEMSLQTCIRRSAPVVYTVTKTNMVVIVVGMDFVDVLLFYTGCMCGGDCSNIFLFK